MTTASIDERARCVRVSFGDGSDAAFPFLWLRDNCPTAFHAQTQERVFDLLSVPADVTPANVSSDAETLTIAWAENDHVSRFDIAWLAAHRPGRAAHDPADVPARIWRSDLTADTIPTGRATDLLNDDAALLAWLQDAKATGLGLVDGLAASPDAGMEVAERIGFLRETNFGRTFEVMSKPDPNNLAYTSHALPLHTDLPNQELPPGFQFLHCIANEAEGGGSVFCDGFAIAEDMREADPAAFEMLRTTAIPLRFHDTDFDIRKHDTVIRCAADGTVEEIRFNAHIAAVFDMPTETMAEYYRAYRAYMTATRDAAYQVRLKLGAGQMVVFDNRRVLHGRDAFDPSTGFRHLRGCYVDRGEWDSRLRVLARHNGTDRD